MRERAATLGAAIRGEHGVAGAIEFYRGARLRNKAKRMSARISSSAELAARDYTPCFFEQVQLSVKPTYRGGYGSCFRRDGSWNKTIFLTTQTTFPHSSPRSASPRSADSTFRARAPISSIARSLSSVELRARRLNHRTEAGRSFSIKARADAGLESRIGSMPILRSCPEIRDRTSP